MPYTEIAFPTLKKENVHLTDMEGTQSVTVMTVTNVATTTAGDDEDASRTNMGFDRASIASNPEETTIFSGRYEAGINDCLFKDRLFQGFHITLTAFFLPMKSHLLFL